MKQIAGIIVAAALIMTGSYGISAAEKKNVEQPIVDVHVRHETISPNPPAQFGVEFHETRSHGWPVLPAREVNDFPMLVNRNVSRETMKLESGSGDFGPYSGERGYRSRQMIMWNLIEYLDLDEETAAVFFAIFKEHNKKRHDLTGQHMKIVSKIIADVSDESVSSKDLKALVKKHGETSASIEKERKAFLEKSRKILDYRQYVKLVVFNDKLKKDLFNRFSKRNTSKERTLRNNSPSFSDKNKNNSELKSLEEVRKVLETQQRKIEEQEKQIQKLQDRQ